MKNLTNPKAFFKNATFKKASGSSTSGGGSDSTGLGGGGDVCVQVAHKDGFFGIRDSKNPNGPVLGFSKEEWEVFKQGIKDGEFDHF